MSIPDLFKNNRIETDAHISFVLSPIARRFCSGRLRIHWLKRGLGEGLWVRPRARPDPVLLNLSTRRTGSLLEPLKQPPTQPPAAPLEAVGPSLNPPRGNRTHTAHRVGPIMKRRHAAPRHRINLGRPSARRRAAARASFPRPSPANNPPPNPR